MSYRHDKDKYRRIRTSNPTINLRPESIEWTVRDKLDSYNGLSQRREPCGHYYRVRRRN